MPLITTTVDIDFIPALYVSDGDTFGKHLVIWNCGLTGSKEGVEAHLHRFAERGFVALSVDPVQHGARRPDATPEALRDRVIGNLQRYFWPILCQSAEEFPRIIDWAIDRLGVTPLVRAGGTSMGGDISVAAAGTDQRIVAVAAGIATPDWVRPGTYLPMGKADSYAQNCYRRRNPLTNLDAYRHCPTISFQSGADDTLVPPDGPQRFADALSETYGACPEKLDVNISPGVGHGFTDDMLDRSIEWFCRW